MLAQAVIRDVGGRIGLDAPVRAGAAPTVSVRGPGNNVYVTAGVAVQGGASGDVNTTLAAAAALGDWTVAVAAATNIAAGRRYRIGPANPTTATVPNEWIRVASITGTTVTLRDRLKNAHANGVAFASTRLEYVVTAAQATALYWDGHAEWDLDSTVHPDNIWTGVECVLRALHNLCTDDDVGARDARLAQRLAQVHDTQRLRDQAFDDVLERLGGPFRTRTLIGSDALIRPTAYRVLYELAVHQGDDKAMERYASLLDEALAQLLATRPADLDQDGVIETHESAPGFGMGRLDRA